MIRGVVGGPSLVSNRHAPNATGIAA